MADELSLGLRDAVVISPKEVQALQVLGLPSQQRCSQDLALVCSLSNIETLD